MFVSVMPTTFAANEVNQKIKTENTAAFDGYSMGEIETRLMEYMNEHYPDIQPNSEAFYDFAVEQLLGANKDQELQSHKDYNLIHIYLSEFKVRYEDYLLCKALIESNNYYSKKACNDIVEDCDSVMYNKQKTDVIFDTSTAFSDKTIGEIKAGNEACEFELSAENAVMPMAVYGYNGYAAASYAREHAKSRNSPTYPSFPLLNQGISGSDCTNFVSQCLIAGGLSMDGSTSKEGVVESTTNWYCKTVSEKYTGQGTRYYYGLTTSWMRVSDFATYMSRRLGPGNVKTYSTLQDLNRNCAVGDPVLLVNAAGTAYHAVIISVKSSSIDGTKYCGHVIDRRDYSITNFDPSDTYRLFPFGS